MLIKLAYSQNAIHMGIANALDAKRPDYANYLMTFRDKHEQLLKAMKTGNSDLIGEARIGWKSIRGKRPPRSTIPFLSPLRKLKLLLVH